MGYAVYNIGGRFGGYGVPTVCEHPECNEEIDRGMDYACGGEPYAEWGCDMYFCGEHRVMIAVNPEGEIIDCEHERDECDCEFYDVCIPCSKSEEQYPYKPEHPDWVKHLLTDKSWEDWRKENPKEVNKLNTSL